MFSRLQITQMCTVAAMPEGIKTLLKHGKVWCLHVAQCSSYRLATKQSTSNEFRHVICIIGWCYFSSWFSIAIIKIKLILMQNIIWYNCHLQHYSPLLKYTVLILGFCFLIVSWASGSSLSTNIELQQKNYYYYIHKSLEDQECLTLQIKSRVPTNIMVDQKLNNTGWQ